MTTGNNCVFISCDIRSTVKKWLPSLYVIGEKSSLKLFFRLRVGQTLADQNSPYPPTSRLSHLSTLLTISFCSYLNKGGKAFFTLFLLYLWAKKDSNLQSPVCSDVFSWPGEPGTIFWVWVNTPCNIFLTNYLTTHAATLTITSFLDRLRLDFKTNFETAFSWNLFKNINLNHPYQEWKEYPQTTPPKSFKQLHKTKTPINSHCPAASLYLTSYFREAA